MVQVPTLPGTYRRAPRPSLPPEQHSSDRIQARLRLREPAVCSERGVAAANAPIRATASRVLRGPEADVGRSQDCLYRAAAESSGTSLVIGLQWRRPLLRWAT